MVKSSTNITKTNKIIPSRTKKAKKKKKFTTHTTGNPGPGKKDEWEQKINKHVQVRFHPKRPNTETRLSTI